ncbi:ABC transporter ATP-binding protein [Photobacterium nomapromontoriensis]|uniref:ABC transporter ATP-binding protein n=1 Tax=Photobacterium nomapromontoriensis TaxID=2910237 RepID=UPI003D145C98
MFANVSVGIDISGGSLRYHDSQVATLEGVNMHIPAQRWTCILGRSGCGKSSLLRYLAGLLGGKVTWSGELMIEPACDLNHQVAYMAQQDLLMPWLSVLDNVMLSTQFGDRASADQQEKALALLDKVGLAEHAKALPQQLSGGMRQRVALVRTLLQDKPVVLMDEPFSALDAVTRYRLQNLACELLADKTVVLITHDPQEALRLAHQLYIMRGQPASAESLCLPSSSTPRTFDPECALLQQTIIDRLEQDYA